MLNHKKALALIIALSFCCEGATASPETMQERLGRLSRRLTQGFRNTEFKIKNNFPFRRQALGLRPLSGKNPFFLQSQGKKPLYLKQHAFNLNLKPKPKGYTLKPFAIPQKTTIVRPKAISVSTTPKVLSTPASRAPLLTLPHNTMLKAKRASTISFAPQAPFRSRVVTIPAHELSPALLNHFRHHGNFRPTYSITKRRNPNTFA